MKICPVQTFDSPVCRFCMISSVSSCPCQGNPFSEFRLYNSVRLQLPLPGESIFRILTLKFGPSPVAPAGGIHFQNSDFEIRSVSSCPCRGNPFSEFWLWNHVRLSDSNLFGRPVQPVLLHPWSPDCRFEPVLWTCPSGSPVRLTMTITIYIYIYMFSVCF